MRTRLIACLVGGLLGALVATPVNSTLGLNPMLALVACSLAGVAVGYVASIFFHIFTANADDQPASPEQ